MGQSHCLLLRKYIREKIGKSVGDKVGVTLQRDLDQRLVETPEELQALLTARNTHDGSLAKRPGTKEKRLTMNKEKLELGKKTLFGK